MNHNWWSMIRWRQPQSYSSTFFFIEAKSSLEQKIDIKSICVRDKSVSYDVHVTLLYWKISISVEITSTLSVQGFSLVTWISGVFSHHTRLVQPFFHQVIECQIEHVTIPSNVTHSTTLEVFAVMSSSNIFLWVTISFIINIIFTLSGS